MSRDCGHGFHLVWDELSQETTVSGGLEDKFAFLQLAWWAGWCGSLWARPLTPRVRCGHWPCKCQGWGLGRGLSGASSSEKQPLHSSRVETGGDISIFSQERFRLETNDCPKRIMRLRKRLVRAVCGVS